MQSSMEDDTAKQPTSARQPSALVTKDDQHVSRLLSTSDDDQPRKRSRSVLHWMQKTLTNVTTSHGHHDDLPPRQRAATFTQNGKPSPARRPPTSFAPGKHHRPRAATIDSDPPMSKKSHRPKKIISDTDAQAQQSPSIFQFMLGR